MSQYRAVRLLQKLSEDKSDANHRDINPAIAIPCPIKISYPVTSVYFPRDIEAERDRLKLSPVRTYGVNNNLASRCIYYYSELTEEEQSLLAEFRTLQRLLDQYSSEENGILDLGMEPYILRQLNYVHDKYGNAKVNEKCYELLLDSLSPIVLSTETALDIKPLRSCVLRAWCQLLQQQSFFIKNYPISDQEKDIQIDLNSGIMYWLGRDNGCKPLLIVNAYKINSAMCLYRLKRLVLFVMEYGMRYLLLPGFVETIVCIIDARNVPMTRVPLNFFSELVAMLTKMFTYRLDHQYIIHNSVIMQSIWVVAKRFLTDLQQQKTEIITQKKLATLLNRIHPSQLEVHFGGQVELDHTKIYPYRHIPFPYANANWEDTNNLIDEQASVGLVWEGDCREKIQFKTTHDSTKMWDQSKYMEEKHFDGSKVDWMQEKNVAGPIEKDMMNTWVKLKRWVAESHANYERRSRTASLIRTHMSDDLVGISSACSLPDDNQRDASEMLNSSDASSVASCPEMRNDIVPNYHPQPILPLLPVTRHRGKRFKAKIHRWVRRYFKNKRL